MEAPSTEDSPPHEGTQRTRVHFDAKIHSKTQLTRSYIAQHDNDAFNTLQERKNKTLEYNGKDVTPDPLIHLFYTRTVQEPPKDCIWTAGTEKLEATFEEYSINLSFRDIRKLEHSTTMEDISAQPSGVVEDESGEPEEPAIPGIHLLKRHEKITAEPQKHTYFKITLTETDDIPFYESPSLTILKEDAQAEEEEIERSKLVEEGHIKRICDAEAQTLTILKKSKAANTDRIKKMDQSSFVSNYDMFDTYAELLNSAELETKKLIVRDSQISLTTYKKDGTEELEEKLGKSDSFRTSSMIIERLLASNIFGERQRRFRNFTLPDALRLDVKYLYRLETLWTYTVPEVIGKAVASVCWCPINGDILAVAYGVYTFSTYKDRGNGYVCIWNIKNPKNPERRYKYSVPVTAVAFSRVSAQLLAVGLYNGVIEIRDITEEGGPPVARSDRQTSPGFEPIMQLEWIMDTNDREAVLSSSLDGNIMKYSIITGLNLYGRRLLRMDQCEGVVEGLAVAKKKPFLEADRHPQAICLKVHPLKKDIYLVGTDEGCLHTCSINYSHQHIGIMQAHQGGIYSIEYSPWSPKLFLTCGADWQIRIWVEEIYIPIVELACDSLAEPFQCAVWSPIHSTCLASCTRNAVQIWDLRRKNLKPASTHTFDATTTLTIVRFSNCGRSLIVGDAEGKIYVCACEEFPFPPHFQYQDLEQTVYRILEGNAELLKQIQERGFLGYEKGATNVC